MWLVEFENIRVQREVEALVRAGRLTKDDQMVISAWIRQVSFHGPQSIRGDQKWADHDLEGEWAGYRSSSFSRRGRILYRIERKLVKIQIARITDIHRYDKKGGRT